MTLDELLERLKMSNGQTYQSADTLLAARALRVLMDPVCLRCCFRYSDHPPGGWCQFTYDHAAAMRRVEESLDG